MKKLLLLICLLVALPAQSAITYFGASFTPVDNAACFETSPSSCFSAGAIAVSPVASMVTGDVVYIYAYFRGGGSGSIAISNTGGQSWNALTNNASSPDALVARGFWARFNGTWTGGNPSIAPSATGNFVSAGVHMLVGRPTTGTNTWGVDVAEVCSFYSAPGGSFDVSVPSQTSIAASTISFATWTARDGIPTWVLQTGGWTNPGGVTQLRNSANGDISNSFAYKIQTSAGATGAVVNRMSSDRNGLKCMVTFKEISAATGWTISPDITSKTSLAKTWSFQASGSGNIWVVDCWPGSTTPTAAELKASTCTGGGTPIATNTKAITTSADTVVSTQASTVLVTDSYAIGRIGGVDTTITSKLADAYSAAAGKTSVFTLTTPCTNPTCPAARYNARASADLVAGDFASCSLLSSPNSYVFTWGTDLNVSYPGPATKETGVCIFQDLSLAGLAADSPATFVFNNSPPVCINNPVVLLRKQGVSLGAGISLVANCSDADGDAITYAVTTGTLNTGYSFSSAGLLTGTPSVESETPNPITITATDSAGDSATSPTLLGVANTLTVPSVVNTNAVSAEGMIRTNGWLTALTTYAFSPTVPIGNVISQSPTAATEVEPFTSVSIVVSLGRSPLLKKVLVH